jgi:hypothetical protein
MHIQRPIHLIATLFAFFVLPIDSARSDDKKPITGGMPFMEPAESGIVVRRIQLRPKQAIPSIGSKLFPTQERLHPGIAAPIFLRQNFEASSRMKLLDELGKTNYPELPLEQLDAAEIKRLTPLQFSELRRAAFRERAGWEYPIGEEPLASILLPDVQETRRYCKAISLRARVDIRQGNLSDAMDKICIGMGLSKHVGETPFIVCKLVQTANMRQMLEAIEELIQHPASENVYWDIAGMPTPMIDTKPAIHLEASMWRKTILELENLDSIRSVDDWDMLFAKWMLWAPNWRLFANEEPNQEDMIRDWTRISRERLPMIWTNPDRAVESMCDSEVSIRYWYERMQARNSQYLAWALLEFHVAIPNLLELTAQHEKDPTDELPVKFSCQTPTPFVLAAARLQQQIDLIRTIESIRDWSAKHAGALPNSLEQLELPVPLDCIVNKPFGYNLEKDGRLAILEGAVIEMPVKQSSQKVGYRYELELD